jgi:FkbM family methyltransferase
MAVFFFCLFLPGRRHLAKGGTIMADLVQLLRNLGRMPRGVIHVGANIGQEFSAYKAAGVAWGIYIEALPSAYERLRQRLINAPNHLPINALCAHSDGEEIAFHVASNDGGSSSMLEFGWHAEQHPDVRFIRNEPMTSRRLDSVIDEVCATHPQLDPSQLDCLVLDVQGAEMRVLQGANRCLARASFVYTEVNEGGLYKNDCSFDDMMAFMRLNRFRLKNLVMNRHNWGDALFVR